VFVVRIRRAFVATLVAAAVGESVVSSGPRRWRKSRHRQGIQIVHNDLDNSLDSDLDSELGILELAAHLRSSVARLARLLRQLDEQALSATQTAALATVERHGPLTLGDLAGVERLSKPSVTNVVGKLEDRGFVRRLTDPGDGRVCRIELTDDGRDHLRETRSRRTAWLVEQLRLRSAEEIERLKSSIGVLDELSGLAPPPPNRSTNDIASSAPSSQVSQ
jgi:DNA-binding MarR family transcriptional regulator